MFVFLIIGVAGLGTLLLALVFGDLFDLLDGGLSGAGLGAGLALFGAAGVLVLANSWPVVLAYPVAVAVGLVTVAAVQLVVRRLRRTEESGPPGPIGLTGVARTRVTPAGGEVSLDGPYEVEARLATSVADIPAGAPVRVIALGGTRVQVEALEPITQRKD